MKQILVLGSDGLIGKDIFDYFSKNKQFTTFGTTRNKKSVNNSKLFLDAENLTKDFEKIMTSLNKVDLIINCIGSKDINDKQFEYINSVFPHLLEDLVEKYNSKLIHISTDAVFPTSFKKATENSRPVPNTTYGKTKLLGETKNQNSITIRTSFIGRGYLNKIKNENELTVGRKQFWSGCTTIQFAKLCEYIAKGNNFSSLRKHSSFFHFAPIKKINKLKISKEIVDNLKLKKKIKTDKVLIVTRYLDSKFDEILNTQKFMNSFKTSIMELNRL